MLSRSSNNQCGKILDLSHPTKHKYHIKSRAHETQECEPYFLPNARRTKCVSKFAELKAVAKFPEYHVLEPDGTLRECQVRSFPDSKGRDCVRFQCNKYDILNKLG